MKSISLKEVRSMNLEPLKVRSLGGYIFHSSDKVYKIFQTNDRKIIFNKARKIEMLSLMRDYAHTFLPIEKIEDGPFWNKSLKGYTTDYRSLGIRMDLLSLDLFRAEDYLKALINATKHLKETHDRSERIVLGDATFENIMVYPNEEGRYVDTKFIDFDSIQIGELESDAVSALLYDYFFVKGFSLDFSHVTPNMDRISYLLAFFYLIFGTDIFNIKPREFDQLSEELNTLYRLRSTFYYLRQCSRIPEVPYLHQVIDVKDAAVLSKVPRGGVKLY